jgi:peroxiredoxin
MSAIRYLMKKFFAFLWLCFVFLYGCGSQEPVQIVKIGDNAPSFVLLDIEGKQVSLSDFKGKVVLIDFWATYCPPCRKSVPFLNELQRTYGADKFTVVGLSMDDSTSSVASFMKEYAIQYPLLMASPEVAHRYNVRGIPTLYLLDEQGRIIYKTLFVNEAEKSFIIEHIEKRLEGNNQDV